MTDDVALLCQNKVESFSGDMRGCGSNLFEMFMDEDKVLTIKCARCGDAKRFRVVECLDQPSQ